MADQPFSDMPPLPANPFSAPTAAPGGSTKTSRLAVASLVLGILACPFSILAGIPGLVCGIMGLNRISRSAQAAASPRLTGQGLAIAGTILSGLSMLILPVMIGLMLPAVQAAREAARRVGCSHNLRTMALGMLAHESAQQILPAAITDADGKPLLSWRVAILPYIEEKGLYEQFHLDEPWDSEHNRTLIAKMPAVYNCPSGQRDDGRTRYMLLDGTGACFEKPRQQTRGRISGVKFGDLRQAPDQTILIVEAPSDRAVEWTKPEDLTVSPDEAAQLQDGKAGGHSRGIRHAAYADGHVEMIHGF
jgi:prepilin-type processing-associated H-X9-DG protein